MADDPQFSRHVKACWPELQGLFAAGEAVAQLAEHPGWVAVQAVLAAEVALVDNGLDRTSAPHSRAEYAMAHGRRDGLRSLQRAADAIVSKATAEFDRQAQLNEAGAESLAERG